MKHTISPRPVTRASEHILRCAEMMATTSPWSQLQFGVEKCRELLSSDGLKVWTAMIDGRVVGFIALRPEGVEGEPLLEYVCVSPEHRRKGIGRDLIRYVEEKKCHKDDNIYLFVSDFNTHAIRLYKSLGYRQVGELPDYNLFGQTEYLYRKSRRPRQQSRFNEKFPGGLSFHQGRRFNYDLNSGYARMEMPAEIQQIVLEHTAQCLNELGRDKIEDIEDSLHGAFLRFLLPEAQAARHQPLTLSTFSGSIALDRVFGAIRRLDGPTDAVQSPLTVILPEPSLDLWQQLLRERSADFDDIQIIGIRDFDSSEQRTDKLVSAVSDPALRPAAARLDPADAWSRPRRIVVVVDSPSNPQGFLMTQHELRRLAAACKKVNAILVVDHCFLIAGLHYDRHLAKRPASAYGLKPDECDWFAIWDTGKSIDLAGDKAAFITAGTPGLRDALARSLNVIQPHTFTAQRSLEVLRGLFEDRTALDAYLETARDLCARNLDFLLQKLPPEWRARKPDAGTFVCVDTDFYEDSRTFAKFWERCKIGVARGRDFMASMFDEGKPVFVRLSLFKPEQVFRTAVLHAVLQWKEELAKRLDEQRNPQP